MIKAREKVKDDTRYMSISNLTPRKNKNMSDFDLNKINQEGIRREKQALRNYDKERAATAKYMKEVQNSPISKLSKLINNPKNVSDWVFSVAGNENHIDDINERFIPRTKNLKDWFTGDNYKRKQREYESYAMDWDENIKEGEEVLGKDSKHVVEARRFKQDAENKANANENLYENAPRQKLVRIFNKKKK